MIGIQSLAFALRKSTDAGLEIMVQELYFHRILRPNQAASGRAQQMVAYTLLGLLLILAPAIMITGYWFLLLVLLSPVALLVLAFIYHNYKMRIFEELEISREALFLRHVKPNGKELRFQTDPHWVKIQIQDEGGPVEEYLTLKDQHRHVELGRFLSPEERRALYRDLVEFKSRL